jgi:hypothetical protein
VVLDRLRRGDLRGRRGVCHPAESR